MGTSPAVAQKGLIQATYYLLVNEQEGEGCGQDHQNEKPPKPSAYMGETVFFHLPSLQLRLTTARETTHPALLVILGLS